MCVVNLRNLNCVLNVQRCKILHNYYIVNPFSCFSLKFLFINTFFLDFFVLLSTTYQIKKLFKVFLLYCVACVCCVFNILHFQTEYLKCFRRKCMKKLVCLAVSVCMSVCLSNCLSRCECIR